MKIYLVEDSPLVQQRLGAMLGELPGARIVGRAATAEEAVDGILETQPDLVVLDVQLGRGSGFEVLREVHWRAPQIQFYVLSNFAEEPYRRHAARLGAKGFFDKSKEFERVRDAVAQCAA